MKTLFRPITSDSLTRIKNDTNGNPRYVMHYTCIERPEDVDIFKAYEYSITEFKKILKGSRKFHNKQYGGGIVFQSYNVNDEINLVNLYNLSFVINDLLKDTGNTVVDSKRINREMYQVTVTDKHNAINDSNVNLFIHVESNDHDKEILNQLQSKGIL